MGKRGPQPKSAESRFWPKVDTSGGPSACWPWKASCYKEGYGAFGAPWNWYGAHKVIGAHRASYRLHYGKDPGDKLVMHACDNPICCNPLHLSVGTYADNSNDAKRKGRSAKGSRNGQAKLTAAEVAEIRIALRNGERVCDVAKRYGVRGVTVSNIKTGKRWRGASRRRCVPPPGNVAISVRPPKC